MYKVLLCTFGTMHSILTESIDNFKLYIVHD